MDICLLQCNVITGDLGGNSRLLAKMIQSVDDADLCIAPLEALCGPNVACLSGFEDFEKAVLAALDFLAKELEHGPALLCGVPRKGPMLLANGLAVEMPSSFYFKEECITIYKGSQDIIPPDTQILVNLDAVRYKPHGQEKLEERLAETAKKIPLTLSVNLVGGYGEKVYNGQSFVMRDGEVAVRGKAFDADIVKVGKRSHYTQTFPFEADELALQWQALVTGTRDFCHKCGAKDAIVGLSGGMDSALVACIAAEALGREHVMGILLPSPYSSEGSITDAEALAVNLGIKTQIVPIEAAMQTFRGMLEPVFADLEAKQGDLTFENLQARIRGVVLMAIANRSGALLLNTGNKSEAAMGYCTLYGDTTGALAVIGDIFKTRVYKLAEWYCGKSGRMIIPREIFDKEPSAELRPDQKDTDSLPPYEELDPMLKKVFAYNEPLNEDLVRLRQKVYSFQFKRCQSPPVLMVGETDMPDCRGLLGAKYTRL